LRAGGQFREFKVVRDPGHFPLQLFFQPLLQLDRQAVNTIAQAGRLWSVFKNMAQVGATLFTHHLRTGYATAVIARLQNYLRFGGLEKTGPTAASIELGLGKEQGFTGITSASAGWKKLGQPQPASNLVWEKNRGSPQQRQLYTPSLVQSQYSPVKGRSVPFSRHT
jgi:hypothetical protein